MRTRTRNVAVLPAVVAAALVASVASASTRFAYGDRVIFPDGFKGMQTIRTDPATVGGVSYVHPAQISIDLNGNFVGIGTYKGFGTNLGANHNCPSHYDPADWSGYYDYSINGVYNCFNFCMDCWALGDSPSFQIYYTYCPTIGNRWVMTFATIRRGCIAGPSSGRRAVAGLEVTSVVEYNVDVKWTNMTDHRPGASSWALCLGDTRPGHSDPNYFYLYRSNCAWDTYLVPLE